MQRVSPRVPRNRANQASPRQRSLCNVGLGNTVEIGQLCDLLNIFWTLGDLNVIMIFT